MTIFLSNGLQVRQGGLHFVPYNVTTRLARPQGFFVAFMDKRDLSPGKGSLGARKVCFTLTDSAGVAGKSHMTLLKKMATMAGADGAGRGIGPMDTQADVTDLLLELAKGNREAGEKLIPVVYDELKRLARGYMRRERPDHTLQTTALVHETYLKLVRQKCVNWQGRSHFFGIAAQLMRRILIDHARRHLRVKRGGAMRTLALNEGLAFSPEQSAEFVKLDEALNRLSKLDARQSRIVELRFFGGLSVEETAEFLGISPKTVKRDWSVAKAWLHSELRRNDGDISKAMGAR